MKLIVEPSYVALCETTSHMLLGAMYQDKRVNLSLTIGASPVGVYEIMTKKMKAKAEDFTNVHFYNFDNADVAGHPQGLMPDELGEMFLSPAGVRAENVHFLTTGNYADYDREIENAGGLDMMLIGMGADGHFCANMPYATDLLAGTYALEMKPEYPWYVGLQQLWGEPMPELMVTMGAASLMKVRQLVLIVNGEKKAEAFKTFMRSEIDRAFPSSVLKLHPNFTVIVDADAARLL